MGIGKEVTKIDQELQESDEIVAKTRPKQEQGKLAPFASPRPLRHIDLQPLLRKGPTKCSRDRY